MHGAVRPALPEDVAEILPEEDGRPPVREDETCVLYVRRQIMGGDLLQKGNHAAKQHFHFAKTRHKEEVFFSKIHLFERCCK